MTLDWRETRRGDFACPISQVVIDEASQGDPAEVRKRWEILETPPLLEAAEAGELQSGAWQSAAQRDLLLRETRSVACRSVYSGGAWADASLGKRSNATGAAALAPLAEPIPRSRCSCRGSSP